MNSVKKIYETRLVRLINNSLVDLMKRIKQVHPKLIYSYYCNLLIASSQ